MKKLLLIVLTTISLFTITGCTTSSDCKYADLFVGANTGIRKNVFDFEESQIDRIDGKVESMNEVVVKDSSQLQMTLKFNSFVSEMKYVNEQVQLITVYSSMFPTNESIIADKLLVSSYQLELFEIYYDTLIAFTKSQYRDSFFPNWDTTDYSHITDREEYYNEEYYALEQNQSTLAIEYDYLLAQSPRDLDAISEKLVEIVENDNLIANVFGYDSYIDYTYENVFSRDYLYEDLTTFTSNVKQNASSVVDVITTYVTNLDNTTKSSLNSLINDSYFSHNENLEDLAKYIGGEYESNFNHFWNNGEYYFGNENSSSAAYVGKTMSQDFTVAYFGPGRYSSLTTVSHEIAHYMAAQIDYKDGSSDNHDLAEAQAQANELLLSAFMLKNNDNKINEAYAVNQLYTSVTTLLQSVIVSDFENIIYTTKDLKAEDISGIMSDLYVEYGVDEIFRDSDEYWPAIFRYYSGYYISYGISVVTALELFFVSQEDFDAAKTDYFTILNGKNKLSIVTNELQYSNPLTTNVIAELCSKIIAFTN